MSLTVRITRTETIGEVETSPTGKHTQEGAALHVIADYVDRNRDTKGSYSVEFPNGQVVGVDLFKRDQEEHSV